MAQINELSIFVKDVIQSDSAISTEDGIQVFDRVSKALDKSIKVSISFAGVDLVVSAFLNAAIGQLYSRFTSDFLNAHLSVVEMQPEDQELLQTVISRAKEYFSNREGFQKVLKAQGFDDNN